MTDANSAELELPGYRLLRPVGSSGAATVYVAIKRSLAREVAAKVFRTMDAASAARIEQLLRANARLSHSNIVGIHQIGRSSDGRLYHSMPLLLGAASARRKLRMRPLKVAAVVRELLDALGYAHQLGVVHGGIKPANVLFDPHGRAKLADFGIAGCAAELDLPHPSAAAYLAPEQLRGEAASVRSDLYSLGAVACELLTGSPPFAADAHGANALERRPPRLPPAASSWQGWIDKALATAPEQRFRSARDMAEALSAIDGRRAGIGGPVATHRGPFPVWAWIIPLLAVAALAIGAVAIWSQRPPRGSHVGSAMPMIPPVPSESTANVAAAASTPAPPSTVALTAAQVQLLVTQGDSLRAHGHLFSPPRENAEEKYLAALLLDPANAQARAGIDALLASLRKRIDAAWQQRQLTAIADLVKSCDTLAKHATHRAQRAWRAQRDALARDVGTAIAKAADAHDPQTMDRLQPLANSLPAIFPAGFDLAAARRRAAIPLAGAKMRDRGGPLLVYVPASANTPAYAIARVNVTRADYAAFARATHRAAASCREAYNPFSRMRHLTWENPGFTQTGNHPVVCVSWNDATAYAAWLSSVTGEPYRLANDSQWLRAAQGMPKLKPCQLGNVDDSSRHSAFGGDHWDCDDGAEHTAAVGSYAASGLGVYGMYGNVSEWLAGGSDRTRAFRGLSFRDGSKQTPLGRRGTAAADVGYTNVGFRVVRLIDAAHPAPPAIRPR
jgi:hypothetical protein